MLHIGLLSTQSPAEMSASYCFFSLPVIQSVYHASPKAQGVNRHFLRFLLQLLALLLKPGW